MTRLDTQLGIIGAQHSGECALALLTEASRACSDLSLDTVDERLAAAEALAEKLVKSIGKLRDENEKQRAAEWEAHFEALHKVVRFPSRYLQGVQ